MQAPKVPNMLPRNTKKKPQCQLAVNYRGERCKKIEKRKKTE
jgi:hypothetical protein